MISVWKAIDVQRNQLLHQMTLWTEESSWESGTWFRKNFSTRFSNSFLSLIIFFSLIFTEWLRIRLFSTYTIAKLSVEICNKKISKKMFLLRKWYHWAASHTVFLTKLVFIKAVPVFQKFHLVLLWALGVSLSIANGWNRHSQPSSSLVPEVEIWAQYLHDLNYSLHWWAMPKRDKR